MVNRNEVYVTPPIHEILPFKVHLSVIILLMANKRQTQHHDQVFMFTANASWVIDSNFTPVLYSVICKCYYWTIVAEYRQFDTTVVFH